MNLVDDWTPDADPPAYVGLYEESRHQSPSSAATAAIPVENIVELLLVAGGDDQVWPSLLMAEATNSRRKEHGLETTLVSDPDAGHRTALPGEAPTAGGVRMQSAGNEASDRRLGSAAWTYLKTLL